MALKVIDLHCHSTLKPYSKSFKVTKEGGMNSKDPRKSHSVWHRKRPTLWDKVRNSVLTVTKFTQADFTTSFRGGARVIIVSIDPMEVELVLNKKGEPQTFLGKLIKNYIIGIGLRRIDYLTNKIKGDYFSDLVKSRDYLLRLSGEGNTSDERLKYEILTHYDSQQLQTKRVNAIFSIEGGHSLNTTKPYASIEEKNQEVLHKAAQLKNWDAPPVWLSLAHHFPNGLCGHGKSMTGVSEKVFDQKLNPEQAMTDLGRKVCNVLLTPSENFRRVLIDVKHMNLKSRLEYYDIARGKGVPIVISHGALMFRRQPSKMTSELNFYDEELIEIACSDGLFGVQLDQRRLKYVKTNSDAPEPPKLSINRQFKRAWKRRTGKRFKKRLYKRAYWVWKQISHFAELLDQTPCGPVGSITQFNGKIWDYVAIGSDFDGIVDPMDGFWTHQDMERLRDYVELNIQEYIKSKAYGRLDPSNKLGVEIIADKVFFENADRFLDINYKPKRQ
ncbi:MAG: membrane dipeptidase [Bacteroidota bacterium]